MLVFQIVFLLFGTFCVTASSQTTGNDELDDLGPADIPPCGLQCLVSAVHASPCDVLDLECVCSSRVVFVATSSCALANCSLASGIKLSKVRAHFCHNPIESRQSIARNWIAGSIPFAVISSILRFTSCWKVRGGFFKEDWCIVMALVLLVTLKGLAWDMVDHGVGLHAYQVNVNHVSRVLCSFFIAEILYAVVISLIKISLISFFLRIFPQKFFRRACQVLMAWICLLGITWLFMLIFQCRPVSSNWSINTEHRKCNNIQIYGYVGAALSICQELIILILPAPLVWNLNINLRKKIGVLVMFSLGIFVIITSALRIGAIGSYANSPDPPWDNVNIMIWTSLEIDVALICCNMPAIAGLFTHYRRKFWPEPADSDESKQSRSCGLGSLLYGSLRTRLRTRTRNNNNVDLERGSVDFSKGNLRSMKFDDKENSMGTENWRSATTMATESSQKNWMEPAPEKVLSPTEKDLPRTPMSENSEKVGTESVSVSNNDQSSIDQHDTSSICDDYGAVILDAMTRDIDPEVTSGDGYLCAKGTFFNSDSGTYDMPSHQNNVRNEIPSSIDFGRELQCNEDNDVPASSGILVTRKITLEETRVSHKAKGVLGVEVSSGITEVNRKARGVLGMDRHGIVVSHTNAADQETGMENRKNQSRITEIIHGVSRKIKTFGVIDSVRGGVWESKDDFRSVDVGRIPIAIPRAVIRDNDHERRDYTNETRGESAKVTTSKSHDRLVRFKQ